MGKVAFITGGASGIGLATARSLASKGWTIAIADLNSVSGEKVAVELNGSFYKTNVADYASLSETFAQVWAKYQRLDFVFANAGIVEKVNFYEKQDSDAKGIPPPLDQLVININLSSIVNTTYLAQHFFRKNSTPGGILVITASSGGLYPIPYLPMYAAAKHGCVGLTFSIADNFSLEGIRVNCICPGSVTTGLLKPEDWAKFPQETFTPIEKVVEAVELLIGDETKIGQAVEIVKNRFYFHTAKEPEDETMRTVMSRTKPLR